MAQTHITQNATSLDSSAPPSGAANRDIKATAQRTFWKSSYAALRHVKCEFCEGVLTLTGQVNSFYLKQIAQAVAQQVAGVRVVDNRLAVQELKQLQGPRVAG